jgi:membrane-associated phospholipid phosphatase
MRAREQAINENEMQRPWYRKAAEVIPKHLYLKGFGTTLFISLFFVAYFYLLKHPAYPSILMQITQVDRLVSFQHLSLPVYLSLWVYISLPPAFLASRRALYEYAAAMSLMCITGLIIFYFWPTVVPVPDIDWTQHPSVSFLKNMDASGNACPSLHVATALFSGIWLNHILRRFGGPPWILTLNWIWCVGIIYSTLAIRQHVVVDVGGGLALGGLATYLSLRHHARR